MPCRAVDSTGIKVEGEGEWHARKHGGPKRRGYHRRSRAETKMHCMKLLRQRLMARDFERQLAEVQIRVAVMNGYTALGIPVTEAVG